MMERILAPSILSADFKVLGEQMELCEKSGAKYLHFDVMDGMFVKNLSFGIPVLASIQGHTGLVMDVHLMIEEPIRYADKIHACGMKAGITIKPDTPVDVLVPYLDQAEMFLIMSVEPGKGGQKFIPESLEKIRTLRALLEERGLHTDIEVDGGIGLDNVKTVLDAGANVIVAGSAVFKGDLSENVSEFVRIFEEDE